jgi:hypothetical protein
MDTLPSKQAMGSDDAEKGTTFLGY